VKRSIIHSFLTGLTFSGVVMVFISVTYLTGCGGRWTAKDRLHPPPRAKFVEEIKRGGIDPPPEFEYRIGVGDTLFCRFFYYPEMLEPQIRVPSTGAVHMPRIGLIKVLGYTEKEVNELFNREYAKHLKFPDVVVRVIGRQAGQIYVDVDGAAKGTLAYNNRLTLMSALQKVSMGGNGAIRSTIIIRGLNTPDFKTFRIDARKILKGEEHDIYLEPDDIVFIPSKFISDVNYFVARYIDGTLGRHVAPVSVFPQPWPLKADFQYDVNVGVDVNPGTGE